jgi:lipoprotein-releasing system permease protein
LQYCEKTINGPINVVISLLLLNTHFIEEQDKQINLKVAGFIANRIAFNKTTGQGGQKSFSRFIIRLSIIATVISVAVMIITLAFANGFQEKVSQKVFSFWGHVRVQEKQPFKAMIAEEIPIIKNDSLADAIGKLPEVESIHPFATKYAILKTKDEIEGVLLKGFDSTYNFNHIAQFIQSGRAIQFSDSTYSREIMISQYTAQQLGLKVNDRIMIYFFRPDGTPRPDKLTVTGIYKTGIEEYDKIFAIGDLKLLQKLNDWQSTEAGGYEIFLKDYQNINRVSEDIYAMEGFPITWDAQSIKDVSPNIFDWLNMQDVTRNVLIGFMIIVAVINLITCLIILVLERVKMIGILKALGATDWTVQKIFLRHSLIITITGILIGAAAAIGFLYLQQATGFIKLQEDAYYLSEAAVRIVWWQVGAICLGTLLVCFLILMIPSILVRKIQPVKAIRFS